MFWLGAEFLLLIATCTTNYNKHYMKSRYLFLVLLFLTSPLLVWSQSGSIRGVVKTSDGNSAEFVNIAIEGTSKGDIADKNGKFEIRNVAPGNYILVASFIGLENTQQPRS